jgi:hypothetical protein
MRLLNTETLKLELFATESKPKYAILSHTWDPEEILFEDARYGKDRLQSCGKSGLDKVLKSAKLAGEDGYRYIWIDTCCIDKSSSAELSEAINSMFAWYQRSAVCYAFLSDYTHHAQDGTLSYSRWFTRGWTLQELIAPSEVRFFDSTWTPFGDRRSLSSHITTITGVDEALLRREFTCFYHKAIPGLVSSQRGCPFCSLRATDGVNLALKSYSISTKMSWAAHRETTRVEDIAYCLVGIFDVAMPLLYGEVKLKVTKPSQMRAPSGVFWCSELTLRKFSNQYHDVRTDNSVNSFCLSTQSVYYLLMYRQNGTTTIFQVDCSAARPRLRGEVVRRVIYKKWCTRLSCIVYVSAH